MFNFVGDTLHMTIFALLFGLAVIIGGWVAGGFLKNIPIRIGATVIGALIMVISIWNTAFIVVPDNKTAHYTRAYLGTSMPDGQIIAQGQQQGPSSEIRGPGLHVVPIQNLLGSFEMLDTVVIPDGYFGSVVAADGRALAEDAVAAAPLPGTSISASIVDDAPRDTGQNVFDAGLFLTSTEDGGFGGQKGLQSTVLKPGEHRINLYLFSVRVTNERGEVIAFYDENGYHDAEDAARIAGISRTPTTTTQIPTGYVGVVRANIDEGWNQNCDQVEEVTQGQLRATLVPVGCKGVWAEPLTPGDYFLNPAVYDVTLIATRAQRYEYRGGFQRCTIALEISADGQIQQERSCGQTIPVPNDAADQAINVTSEGWQIPVELRVLGQVTADQAPAVVAAVGDLDAVEDRIITPMIRSRVRNIGGGRIYAPIDPTCEFNENRGEEVCEEPLFTEDTPHPFLTNEDGSPFIQAAGTPAYAYRPTRALDFHRNRDALEAAFADAIMSASTTAGINLLEVTMGEPAVPPELTVPQQRDQLARQLRVTFAQEEEAQQARIAAEQQRATADQQGDLVAAQIYAQTQVQRGEADRDYARLLAEGQRAQVSVLGEENVMQLRELELQLDLYRDLFEQVTGNPEALGALARIQLPRTVLLGGNSLENAGQLLGGAMNETEE
jgi:regulator of protease activity HflC (stomatin/prohibitin superfamily)